MSSFYSIYNDSALKHSIQILNAQDIKDSGKAYSQITLKFNNVKIHCQTQITHCKMINDNKDHEEVLHTVTDISTLDNMNF